MDVEAKEMFQAIMNGMEGLENRLDMKLKQQREDFQEVLDQQTGALTRMMDDKVRGVMVLVENEIGKRIDSLFDGYKLNHEKQWELERKMEQLEKRIEQLEVRAG